MIGSVVSYFSRGIEVCTKDRNNNEYVTRIFATGDTLTFLPEKISNIDQATWEEHLTKIRSKIKSIHNFRALLNWLFIVPASFSFYGLIEAGELRNLSSIVFVIIFLLFGVLGFYGKRIFRIFIERRMGGEVDKILGDYSEK
jgi:hypothetical protein